VANFKISCRYLLASVINVAAEVSANEITEISLYINGTSEGPMIELNPHEFWWLICASLSVVATLVFILLMLRGPLPPNKSHSEPCWSQTGKNMPIENKKSTALCFGKKTKTKMKSSKTPRLGSFIENVDIPVSKEVYYTLQ